MVAKSPNPSPSVQAMVKWLNSQVGTRETGNNCVKYWTMSTKPEWNCSGNWCQAFVQVALDQNGHPYIPCSGDLFYLVPAAVQSAKARGKWIPAADRIGKVDPAKPNTMYAVVLGWRDGKPYQHIGWMIDWWDAAGNYVQTIEGNTGSTSQTNGEGVYEKHRAISGAFEVNGFIEVTLVGPTVGELDNMEVVNPKTGKKWPVEGALWSIWKYTLDAAKASAEALEIAKATADKVDLDPAELDAIGKRVGEEFDSKFEVVAVPKTTPEPPA